MYFPIEQLSPHSRIWIYQADREFASEEEKIISEALILFCSAWEAHGAPLKTSFEIVYRRFVILVVDESSSGASGCSIDGSVHVLKELGNQLKIDFFDRTKVAFLENDKVQMYPLHELRSLFDSGQLTSSSIAFNNLVTTKEEWERNWKTTPKKSWLVKYLPGNALSV